MKYLYFFLFVGTVVLANWLIGNVGECHPNGPCVIPVWFGIYAPSGVLSIGLAFTLRDLVQHSLGVKWTILAIVIGALLSSYLSPYLALASGCAFLFSELMDLMVYTPLHHNHFWTAVIGSNIVGLVTDSAIFLFLAFGSLQFLEGQVLGKFWMTLVALPVIYLIRQRREVCI